MTGRPIARNAAARSLSQPVRHATSTPLIAVNSPATLLESGAFRIGRIYIHRQLKHRFRDALGEIEIFLEGNLLRQVGILPVDFDCAIPIPLANGGEFR